MKHQTSLKVVIALTYLGILCFLILVGCRGHQKRLSHFAPSTSKDHTKMAEIPRYELPTHLCNVSPSENENTIFIYHSFSRDLYPFMRKNIDHMAHLVKQSKNQSLRFVFLLKGDQNRYGSSDFHGVRIFEVSKEALESNRGQSAIRFVKELSAGLDTGSATTLRAFLDFVVPHYPARRQALVVSGHGKPWNRSARSAKEVFRFCPDDSLGTSIPTKDIQTAIGSHCFSFIAFETCSMASIEVLNECTGLTNYVLASQSLFPGQGYHYYLAFKELLVHPNIDTLSLLKNFFLATKNEQFLLSIANMNNLTRLNTALATLSETLRSSVTTEKAKNYIRATRQESFHYSYDAPQTTRDLGELLNRLKQKNISSSLNLCIETTQDALKNTIICSQKSTKYPNSTGLTIEFSGQESFKHLKEDYKKLHFSQQTGWHLWLSKAP